MSGQDWLEAAFEHGRLWGAWERVLSNGGSPGVDGETLGVFGRRAEENLFALRESVLLERYTPSALLVVDIERTGRAPRRLAIPSVRDRIAQTAVANFLTPVLDAEFEDTSFGYRRGRSVDMAVRRVMRLRDQGFRWVVDADITAFFDEIDRTLLLLELSLHIPSTRLLTLIRRWLQAPLQTPDTTYTPIRGVPQGSPLSPLLANLYLDWFDEQLVQAKLRPVRFADDFLVLCRSEADAEEALALSDELLGALGLAINEEKTRIRHFDDGFRFLGVRFLRSLVMKSTVEDEPIKIRATRPQGPAEIPSRPRVARVARERPLARTELRTLYVLEPGSRLSREGESVLVHNDERLLRRVPLRQLDLVVAVGAVQMTTQMLTGCAARGVPVAVMSRTGRLQGVFDAHISSQSRLHRAQFVAADDPAWSNAIAASLIGAKINNCAVVLSRYARSRELPGFAEAARRLRRYAVRARTAEGRDALLGLEGAAAAEYYRAWREEMDECWGFEGRRRRPPPDPINAMLSFGYTVLFQNAWAFVRARGLHSFVGALHVERPGHPSLVSDLIEPFRAPVVDSAVLALVLGADVRPNDFEIAKGEQEPSCRMALSTRRQLIHALERRMSSPATPPEPEPDDLGPMDYRRAIDRQVQSFSRALGSGAEAFDAFRIR